MRGDEPLLVTAMGNLIDNAVAYSPDEHPGRRRHPRPAEDAGRDLGHRPGHRHRPGRGRADLRALLPGRPGPVARHRRHRPRPGHRQAHRHQPRRHDLGVEHAGRRLDLHRPAAWRSPGRHRPAPLDVHPEPGGFCVTRILVVEDEESFSDALSYMLRREGFEVASPAPGPRRSPSSTAPVPTWSCST